MQQYLPSVDMTIPRVTRDLLMLAPSLSLSPIAPLVLARSLEKKNDKNKLKSTVLQKTLKEVLLITVVKLKSKSRRQDI